MTNSTRAIAAAAAAILTGAAQADLTGTSMDLQLAQSGFAGDMAGPSGGSYMYGTLDTFDIEEVFTWDAVSPGLHPAFDNSILLDFSNFGYAAYIALGPSISTLDVTSIAEDVEITKSPAVFLLSDLNTNIAQSTSTFGNSFSVGWDVGMVIDDNPLAPSVIVGWNSVPAPGAMALLGLAGLTVIRRRRRH